MALQDKYINPFTDFGFKKLFGSEPNKDLLIDFLNQVLPGKHKVKDLTYARTEQLPHLQSRPPALQERVFQKLFEAAEIARFTPDEKNKYEESLKYYRDLKNVVDTSFDEGKAEGLAEGKAEGLAEGKAEIALQMKLKGLETSLISEVTGLSVEEIEHL